MIKAFFIFHYFLLFLELIEKLISCTRMTPSAIASPEYKARVVAVPIAHSVRAKRPPAMIAPRNDAINVPPCSARDRAQRPENRDVRHENGLKRTQRP